MSEKQQELASESETGNRDQGIIERQEGASLDRQLLQQPPPHDHHLIQQQETAAVQTQSGGDHGGAPAVRLDMDLDVDIQLRAKIEGHIIMSIFARDERGSSRDLSRGDSDMHNLLSQVAVGVFAFGIRHLIHRRREAKRQAQAAAQVNPKGGVTAGQTQRPGAIDPELSGALNTVARELQGASDSIRRLASSAPSHRNCAVREALIADADRLHRSLANMQTSINNMRNLHPGLDQRRDLNRLERSRRQEKDGRQRRTEDEVGSTRRDRDQPRQSRQRRSSRWDDERRNGQQS
ncbi:hypothetical protein MMYC01_203102 [Madurella mycetomatis]|uniref:Uncharacterized protein n=1 Tax=Madurella mycetomatis TaxID=100816 RepID=A0A175WCG1_9PEZI|nr:hypothetical protein MMYC01_203102 [Madurella mycetomatis]